MSLFYISGSQPRLMYNHNEGEAHVHFPANWRRCSPIWQIDCLDDWIAELEAERARIMTTTYPLGQQRQAEDQRDDEDRRGRQHDE